MLRRTLGRRGYQAPNPDVEPSFMYGPFGWAYNISQAMDVPRTRNRTASMPFTGRHVNRYKGLTSITLDAMHPVFRVALNPYLSKLVLNRRLPKTPVQEAIDDFAKVSPRVGDAASRHAWLAKVLELAAIRGDCAAAVSLFTAGECTALFLKGAAVPPLALAKAVVHGAAVGKLPEWKALFEASKKAQWNTSPQFCNVQWSALLTCAGQLGDGAGVISILDEMLDVQADLERVPDSAYIWALNAVPVADKALYDNVKAFLHKLTAEKSTKLFKAYKRMRNTTERGGDPELTEESFKENDGMFYHVGWHARIRQPLEFNPRQLFFDFQPPKVVDTRDRIKMSIDDVMKSRVAKWKDEGYLPEDYEAEESVDDKEGRTKAYLRKELWKKKPAILEDKRFGYTPE